jgi:hypothetical protein
MNSPGIEHLKYFDNTVKSEAITYYDMFRVQQSCHMGYSPVQRRLIIFNLKKTREKFIIIDMGAKPFVHNKKPR